MARRHRRPVSVQTFLATLAASLLVLLLLRLLPPPAPPPSARTEALPGTVGYVYDGDTLEVGGVGKVRVIGIDTMDGHNAEKARSQSDRYGLTARQVEHWAEEATSAAIDRLQGRRVVLHTGTERLDMYGRTLAYVHVPGEAGDEEDFGLMMLDAGLAATYRGASHARSERSRAAERLAQLARKGMWKDARVQP